jgi:hypothetical protein
MFDLCLLYNQRFHGKRTVRLLLIMMLRCANILRLWRHNRYRVINDLICSLLSVTKFNCNSSILTQVTYMLEHVTWASVTVRIFTLRRYSSIQFYTHIRYIFVSLSLSVYIYIYMCVCGGGRGCNIILLIKTMPYNSTVEIINYL